MQADLRIEREFRLARTVASLFYSNDFRESAYVGGAKQTYFLGARWQF
jgi:hypothetical protein